MIPMPSGVRVWIAAGHTDMGRGMQALGACPSNTKLSFGYKI